MPEWARDASHDLPFAARGRDRHGDPTAEQEQTRAAMVMNLLAMAGTVRPDEPTGETGATCRLTRGAAGQPTWLPGQVPDLFLATDAALLCTCVALSSESPASSGIAYSRAVRASRLRRSNFELPALTRRRPLSVEPSRA